MSKPLALLELYANIGRQLRRVRKMNGLTLEELADRCGRDWSFLSQIERGKTVPSIETLYLISEQLHIPITALLSDVDTKVDDKIDPIANKISHFLVNASLKDKKMAVDMIKKLFKQ